MPAFNFPRHFFTNIIFWTLWLTNSDCCPVHIISNNAHSTPSTSIFTSQDIENSESPLSGVTYEAEVPFSNNTGLISSSKFVSTEFSKFKCQFVFVGAVDEYVQVSFQKFNLFLWKNLGDNISSIRCEEKDHVSAHVLVGARMSKISDFCGSEIPPQLMSAKNILTLEYVIRSANSREPKSNDDYGFVLEYRFVRDFSPLLPPEALREPNRKCGLVFNGTIQSSGNLWSINYPGYYPRNLNCEYVFNGRDNQIVLIHFEYFDVEGFGQCEESTHSDYVLFSNYRTTDRTNRRYCGNQRPPRASIASESNYFRMIFRTNDIFDGTGFYAHYQFIDPQSKQKTRVKLTSHAPHPTRPQFLYLLFSIASLTFSTSWFSIKTVIRS